MKTSARNSLFMPVSVGLVTLAFATQAFAASGVDRSVEEQKYWSAYEQGLEDACTRAKPSRASQYKSVGPDAGAAGYFQARWNVHNDRTEFCAPGALNAVKSNYTMNNTRYAEAAPSTR